MNFIKKILVKSLIVAIILTLFACGVNTKNLKSLTRVNETSAAYSAGGVNSFAMKQAMPMADIEEVVYEADAVLQNGTTATEVGADKNGRKLIRRIDLNTETKSFDEMIKYINSQVEEFNGVIDSSYVDSGSIDAKNYRRNANFNIRIPAEKLDDFYLKLSEKLNVVFKQENVTDVTDNYDDTEAKVKSLRLEVNKLNELLTRATSVEDLIKVEDKLTEVRHELERYEKRKKNLDKQINYSTINLNVSEVKELSEVEEPEDISKETLIKKLKKNLEDTKKFIINVGVYIFTHIPAILLIILCLAIVSLILALLFKPKKQKKEKKKETINKNSNDINVKKDENIKDLADKML